MDRRMNERVYESFGQSSSRPNRQSINQLTINQSINQLCIDLVAKSQGNEHYRQRIMQKAALGIKRQRLPLCDLALTFLIPGAIIQN